MNKKYESLNGWSLSWGGPTGAPILEEVAVLKSGDEYLLPGRSDVTGNRTTILFAPARLGEDFFLDHTLALKALEEQLASTRHQLYEGISHLDYELMKVREELKGQDNGGTKPRC